MTGASGKAGVSSSGGMVGSVVEFGFEPVVASVIDSARGLAEEVLTKLLNPRSELLKFGPGGGAG